VGETTVPFSVDEGGGKNLGAGASFSSMWKNKPAPVSVPRHWFRGRWNCQTLFPPSSSSLSPPPPPERVVGELGRFLDGIVDGFGERYISREENPGNRPRRKTLRGGKSAMSFWGSDCSRWTNRRRVEKKHPRGRSEDACPQAGGTLSAGDLAAGDGGGRRTLLRSIRSPPPRIRVGPRARGEHVGCLFPGRFRVRDGPSKNVHLLGTGKILVGNEKTGP